MNLVWTALLSMLASSLFIGLPSIFLPFLTQFVGYGKAVENMNKRHWLVRQLQVNIKNNVASCYLWGNTLLREIFPRCQRHGSHTSTNSQSCTTAHCGCWHYGKISRRISDGASQIGDNFQGIHPKIINACFRRLCHWYVGGRRQDCDKLR